MMATSAAVMLLGAAGAAQLDTAADFYNSALRGKVETTTDDGRPGTTRSTQAAASPPPRKLTPAEVAPYPPMQWHSWVSPDNVQIMARERSLPIRFELFGRRVFGVGYTSDCPVH
jgi:hypothetical protein